MGWPLGGNAGGGSFCYHGKQSNLSRVCCSLKLRKTPCLSIYGVSKFKHHPMIKEMLEGGKRISYGARAITEGGYQSIPKLAFPVV